MHFLDQPGHRTLRDGFRIAAHSAGAALHEHPHPLAGPFGETMSTDVAVWGDPAASRILLTLSGTHGVEGFYGSTCQSRWLMDLAKCPPPADTAVVMVHLINPWGCAWLRRVNEDNIDLNRNYLDFTRPLPQNQAYEALHRIYTCSQLRGPARDLADALLASHIARQGWDSVMAVVEGGQYHHADGLFYGGIAPSWSNRTLHAIASEHLATAETIMSFDLHTGAGAYGHPMLMTITEAEYPALATAQGLYGPWLDTLHTGAGLQSQAGVAATATGYTSQALLNALPAASLMPFVIECGTYPGQDVHLHLRNDHWLHMHGDPNDATGRAIKRGLLEQFYPNDPDWLETVWHRTRQIWQRALTAPTDINRQSAPSSTRQTAARSSSGR